MIEPGAIYYHYKGGRYVVIAVGLQVDTDSGCPVVIYRKYDHGPQGQYFVRTIENFTEPITVHPGYSAPRFFREGE